MIMTLYFPNKTPSERFLERIGRPRAFFVGGKGSERGSATAVPEAFWRSLLRKPGKPLPDGWSFRVDGPDLGDN